MKNKKIFIIVSIILLIVIFIIIFGNKPVKLSDEDKNELMTVLGIEDAPSFEFISINKENLGFGDGTDCYTLKFKLSVEDYNKNNLNYKEGESAELACNFKVKKDDNTYICSVREWEYYIENRKPVYDEILKINSKYYGIKALKILANFLENK